MGDAARLITTIAPAATVHRASAYGSELAARTRLPERPFLDEDTDLMTPAEAMALVPRPELLF